MHKSALAVAALLATSVPAAAATWLVTEENTGGIKGAQGSWNVKTEGNKLSGDASMQMGNGSTLTYKFEGESEGANYTVTLSDRTDGKKGCVWKGHPPASGGAQAKGLVGYVECDGDKLIIRASVVE
ncbi:hypothetical protein F7D14_02255 [Methylocystis parvus]|uniref:Uncharacterized protein n=2 Tax=Methylocystis parvus TaxID=134 RepID=A0A6B8MD02_9HYPH|nr:hypothetical protein F7D14_02255 [Methylocystis parvus]